MRRELTIGLTLGGLASLATLCVWALQVTPADAHCQVPCGIYDDQARITAIREDATTIGKSIAKINELAGAHAPLGMNQATRWVMTKEHHASNIITVVARENADTTTRRTVVVRRDAPRITRSAPLPRSAIASRKSGARSTTLDVVPQHNSSSCPW